MRPVRSNDAPEVSKWRLMEWVARGGYGERRLAAWVAEQRHLAASNRLSSVAMTRLEVQFCPLACEILLQLLRFESCNSVYLSCFALNHDSVYWNCRALSHA
jgi:hypothetical protein